MRYINLKTYIVGMQARMLTFIWLPHNNAITKLLCYSKYWHSIQLLRCHSKEETAILSTAVRYSAI